MREILFKGKKKDNGEWIEGYLFDDGMSGEKRMFIGKLVIAPYEGPIRGKWTVIAHGFDEVDPDTICEYTGLTDKDGNKIWENDIVNTDSNAHVQIKFGLYSDGFTIWKYHQGFYMDFSDRGRELYRHELGYWHNKIEVIGNIFDNPELLQERTK